MHEHDTGKRAEAHGDRERCAQDERRLSYGNLRRAKIGRVNVEGRRRGLRGRGHGPDEESTHLLIPRMDRHERLELAVVELEQRDADVESLSLRALRDGP